MGVVEQLGETFGASAPPTRQPTISLVVPGLNEAESLPLLGAQVAEALGDTSYELILVDDGSTDETWKVINELHGASPAVRGVRLRKNFGKAMALSAGFERARADIVITMDADLQDDPADVPRMVEKIEQGFDVVVGWKVERRDPLNRRMFSKIFNGTVGLVSGVRLHDMNCGFKAFRREAVRSIPIYGDLFRFIPVLATWQGFTVGEIPVHHREREFGNSRYGLERILRSTERFVPDEIFAQAHAPVRVDRPTDDASRSRDLLVLVGPVDSGTWDRQTATLGARCVAHPGRRSILFDRSVGGVHHVSAAPEARAGEAADTRRGGRSVNH